ncbi:MAG: 4Fe-4S binding protein [Clostridia bacterium]
MTRKIIQIDEKKCVGCGLCANACKQSAIEMVDGKAKVVRDDYCDGLGNCLPVCPVGAISFSDNDIKNTKEQPKVFPSACPGTFSKTIERNNIPITQEVKAYENTSQLNQWPVQIKLAPPMAPFLKNAKLLIAADCTAFAYGNFHNEFMKNKITLIGCPKLDEGDYTDKLTKIIRDNDLKSVTVVRMEVPCCGGLENAVKNALIASGKMIPWQVVTITTNGKILD